MQGGWSGSKRKSPDYRWAVTFLMETSDPFFSELYLETSSRPNSTAIVPLPFPTKHCYTSPRILAINGTHQLPIHLPSALRVLLFRSWYLSSPPPPPPLFPSTFPPPQPKTHSLNHPPSPSKRTKRRNPFPSLPAGTSSNSSSPPHPQPCQPIPRVKPSQTSRPIPWKRNSTGSPTGTLLRQSVTSTSGFLMPRLCWGSMWWCGGTRLRGSGRCLTIDVLTDLPRYLGRIDQRGRLQCVYHGWCFDGSGSCKYIPQEPSDGPQVHTFTKACASAYPSFEQNNIVWFWPSTDPQNKDIVMKKKPPYFPELDDPSYSCLMLTRDIPYGYEVLIENLMDPAHLPYAHYGIMQLPKHMIPQFRYKSGADREGGSPLQITVEKLDVSGFLAKQEMGDSKFIAPCVFYIFPSREPNNASCSTESLKKELSTSPQQKQRRMLLVFICIPVSPGISRLITVAPKNFGLWVERIVPRWMFHVEQNRIIDSDLYLLHLEERKIAQVGPSNWQKACFVPTKSDALVVAFRKWLRKYAHNQVDWGTKFTSELPPTPPKEQLMDRYWSHVVQCSSCHGALKGLKALEVSLQVISVALIGIVSAIKQTVISTATRSVLFSLAVLSFAASRWLSHFIYKNFYFHDYNHAFRHGTCYTNNWIQSLVSSLAI